MRFDRSLQRPSAISRIKTGLRQLSDNLARPVERSRSRLTLLLLQIRGERLSHPPAARHECVPVPPARDHADQTTIRAAFRGAGFQPARPFLLLLPGRLKTCPTIELRHTATAVRGVPSDDALRSTRPPPAATRHAFAPRAGCSERVRSPIRAPPGCVAVVAASASEYSLMSIRISRES